MQIEYEFDVFISYSSRDKAWVRGELLKRIEQAGLKTFIDFRDFTRGAPSIKEMERGVMKCRKTLLILTPNYIASGWAEIENIMVQTLDPANRELRLIPLLKTECEKPLRIGALTHIDFTDNADLNLAWRQLLTALGKPPEPEPPKEPQRDDWLLAHPYPMPPNFTGRAADRVMLNRWLDADAAHPLLVLRALGGFGKSALAWHWITHDVAPAAWSHVIWWSFYESDSSFNKFTDTMLDYLSKSQVNTKSFSEHDEIRKLLRLLQQPGILLVLDGFERELRAFGGPNAAYQGDEIATDETNERDCLSPFAEKFLRAVSILPGIQAKILITTRLCPRALESHGGSLLRGCRVEELKQMQPTEAMEFFRAFGIRGTHTEIEAACELYGYHPLSLRLLAGLIVSDLQQPGDIAAAKRLDVSGDLVQRKHHVLDAAYNTLTVTRQAFLGRIACFRSPVRYEALNALAEEHGALLRDHAEQCSAPQTFDADLRGLVARGLLHHDTREGRFDLHPIVRRYAYNRLTAPERAAAHSRLRDFFAVVPKPDKVTRLADLAPVIELYHHTVRAGQYDAACMLLYDRIHKDVQYQFGAYLLSIDLLRALFPDGENRPPRLKDVGAQAWTLGMLAHSYGFSGQPRRAMPLFEQQIDIRRNKGDKVNLVTGLENLAAQQIKTGKFQSAESNLRCSISLSQSIQDAFSNAIEHRELGELLAYRGLWTESDSELALALKALIKQKRMQSEGIVWACKAKRVLLMLRHSALSSFRKSRIAGPQDAFLPARRALRLANETARTEYTVPRDYVCAHWLLGAAHRVAGQHDDAERYLYEALERCRRINLVEMEADILIDLTRLRAATGELDEAQRQAEEALVITERSGYVLQGADTNLELAKLALARGDKVSALHHASETRRLATCDGPPDYTYKVAYDEAGALLAELETRHEENGGAGSK